MPRLTPSTHQQNPGDTLDPRANIFFIPFDSERVLSSSDDLIVEREIGRTTDREIAVSYKEHGRHVLALHYDAYELDHIWSVFKEKGVELEPEVTGGRRQGIWCTKLLLFTYNADKKALAREEQARQQIPHDAAAENGVGDAEAVTNDRGEDEAHENEPVA